MQIFLTMSSAEYIHSLVTETLLQGRTVVLLMNFVNDHRSLSFKLLIICKTIHNLTLVDKTIS